MEPEPAGDIRTILTDAVGGAVRGVVYVVRPVTERFRHFSCLATHSFAELACSILPTAGSPPSERTNA
ncbi:MAG: hypothetical protein JJT81_12040 [Rubellimicrobium sp.]|nr:hypothetical protein [Rubellimicrobium sp.]